MPAISLRRGTGALAVLAMLAVTGCAPRTLYNWGIYEDDLYRAMVKGAGDPQTRASRLAADIEKTTSRGKRVPPGVRVELAYLYAQLGRTSDARAEFEAEKAAFPESTAFVDGMIARMDHAAGSPRVPATTLPATEGSPSPQGNEPVTDRGAAPQPAALAVPTSTPTIGAGTSPGATAAPQPAPAKDLSAAKPSSQPQVMANETAPTRPRPARTPPSAQKAEPRVRTAPRAQPSAAETQSEESRDPIDPLSLMPPSFEERD